MKINELVQVGTRMEQRTRIVPAVYDDDGNILTEETTEVYEVEVPVMEPVTRDMTAEEEAEYLASMEEMPDPEPTEADRISALEAENAMLTECILELAEIVGGADE